MPPRFAKLAPHHRTPFELAAVFLPGVYGLIQLKLDDPRSELATALHRTVDIFVRGIMLGSKGGPR